MSSPLFRLAHQIPLEASWPIADPGPIIDRLVSTTWQAPLPALSPHPARRRLPCPASTAARGLAPARAGSAWGGGAQRRGGGGDQPDRLARGQILADLIEAPGGAQLLEQLLRLRAFAFGDR